MEQVKDGEVLSSRRDFLLKIGGLAAAVVAAPVAGVPATPRVVGARRNVAPGDRIRILWPRGLDHGRCRVVHELNGRGASSSPAPEPTGFFLPVMEVIAIPPDGSLRPGRHEFYVENEGRRLALGGFNVKPFRFGF